MCEGKKAYDKQGALGTVNYRSGRRHGFRGKTTRNPNRNLRAYQCPICGWWHITDAPLFSRSSKRRTIPRRQERRRYRERDDGWNDDDAVV